MTFFDGDWRRVSTPCTAFSPNASFISFSRRTHSSDESASENSVVRSNTLTTSHRNTSIRLDVADLDPPNSPDATTETHDTPPLSDGWATFNVDRFLVERVISYNERIRFNSAIETGTFRGETTVGLAKLFPKVFTIEVNPEHFESTKPRFRFYPNITFLLGNSAQLMPGLLDKVDYPLFAYLDAHWQERCPLRDEIAALLAVKKPKLIMIHDFKVPGRNFGFDEYDRFPNSLEYIADLLHHDECRYAFNHQTAPQSANRGVLFIEHLLAEPHVPPEPKNRQA